jgi:hypothetical protein
LQGIANATPKNRPKNEAVWQENGWFGQRILHIFSSLSGFAWIPPLHVPANQWFAQIGAITKKDAQKPTIGFLVFGGCGKFRS